MGDNKISKLIFIRPGSAGSAGLENVVNYALIIKLIWGRIDG